MSSGRKIIVGVKKRWQLMQVVKLFLYASGPAILSYFLFPTILLALAIFSSIFVVGLMIKKPWKLTLEGIGGYIDTKLREAEYSTGLLLLPKNQMSSLALLQRSQVSQVLEKNKDQIKPDVSLKKPLLVFALCILLAFLVHLYGWASDVVKLSKAPKLEETITFQPLDSSKVKVAAPKLVDQQLNIIYPSYTKKTASTTGNMNVRALEGSLLKWNLRFDKPTEKVVFESSTKEFEMTVSDKGYRHRMVLSTSGFYNFKFKAPDGASYQSELYTLEVFQDEPPQLEIQDLKQFTSFDFHEGKTLDFATDISDDYGISEAYIVATVSKGEGESVKFREERLAFETAISPSGKNQKLLKHIDLDKMGMEPGDELYFYVAARDNKEPKSNITRSETFFAVIRDTVSGQFEVEGTMGTDLMPDYFRSQRQLIIDTEKLIANKSKLSKKDFNTTSNELGFDQKALRLKYGQFMGDEADSGIQVAEDVTVEEATDDSDNKDPLAGYTHDHDGTNEENLVDHDHHKEGEHDSTKKDPLENYVHNHDDPEESTLFTQSLKSKLRQAMTEMWDAELHLRLYTPEKSLPYQYRALKLIQEIKNSARIYVHRIGFDPPPIKEDKRLTGDLDEVSGYQKQLDINNIDAVPFILKAVQRLEQLKEGELLVEEDRVLFSKAGNELAQLAIQEPGEYLGTLQQLKLISDSSNAISKNQIAILLGGLLEVIPRPESKPTGQLGGKSKLNDLFLKELEIND